MPVELGIIMFGTTMAVACKAISELNVADDAAGTNYITFINKHIDYG